MKEKIAVIQLGGIQHLVKVGDQVKINHIEGDINSKIVIDDVFLYSDENNTEIGNPNVGYTVTAEILEQKKDKKIDTFKYKAKARYRRNKGHRQSVTVLEIKKIEKKSAK